MFKKPIRSLSIFPSLAALLLLTSAPTFASQLTADQQPEQASQNGEEKIFTAIETSPKFPGGDVEMYKFLSMNVRYPERSQKECAQGYVIVNFSIEPDGSIGETKIINAEEFENQSKMPVWEEGTSYEEFEEICSQRKWFIPMERIYVIGHLPENASAEADIDADKVNTDNPNLEAEAIRLVKSLPKFTPATLNGAPVRSWCTLPIVFKLIK